MKLEDILQAEKQVATRRAEMTVRELRNECRDHALDHSVSPAQLREQLAHHDVGEIVKLMQKVLSGRKLDADGDREALELRIQQAEDRDAEIIARRRLEEENSVSAQKARANSAAIAQLVRQIGTNFAMLVNCSFIGIHVSDKGMPALAHAMKSNEVVKSLTIQNNKIAPRWNPLLGVLTHKGLNLLVSSLKNSPASSLVDLQLGCNCVGDAGAKILAEYLKTNPPLHTLNLYDNGIGDEGVKTLAAPLMNNAAEKGKKIKKKRKDKDKEAGGGGVRRGRAEVIRFGNTSLTSLGLGYNKVTDVGVLALADALVSTETHRPHLCELDLHYNMVQVRGARRLAQVLEKNESLKELILSRNSIGTDGGLWLAASLRANKTLKTLHVEQNGLGPEAEGGFREVLLQDQREQEWLKKAPSQRARMLHNNARHWEYLNNSLTDLDLLGSNCVEVVRMELRVEADGEEALDDLELDLMDGLGKLPQEEPIFR